MSDEEAEREAVRRFGPPGALARQLDRYATPFRWIFWGASGATALIALWLLWVIAVVLPLRDPGHIPLWRTIAAAFLLYSGISWASLLRGPRSPLLRAAVIGLSILAVAAGVFGIEQMVRRAAAGGHFEGYIILMGLALCLHGLAAFVHTLLTARIVRQLAAPR